MKLPIEKLFPFVNWRVLDWLIFTTLIGVIAVVVSIVLRKDAEQLTKFNATQCHIELADTRTVQTEECRSAGKGQPCGYKVLETNLVNTLVTTCTKRMVKRTYLTEQPLP